MATAKALIMFTRLTPTNAEQFLEATEHGHDSVFRSAAVGLDRKRNRHTITIELEGMDNVGLIVIKADPALNFRLQCGRGHSLATTVSAGGFQILWEAPDIVWLDLDLYLPTDIAQIEERSTFFLVSDNLLWEVTPWKHDPRTSP